METLTEAILKIIQPRNPMSHKGNYGRVVLIGGDAQYGGAIIMSAEACIQSGAGLVTVITDPINHCALHARLPEAMVVDWFDLEKVSMLVQSADVLLIGPGLGLQPYAQQLFQLIIMNQTKEQFLIIDGSAITLFSEVRPPLLFPNQTIFTPHQMEWQRLSKLEISEQTVTKNHLAQKELEATIVLKSHETVVYTDIQIWKNPLGNPGMATGGTGDVLAGMIAGFIAQFSPTFQAVLAAVYLHSYIGDQLAKTAYLIRPTQISKQIPYWMRFFEKQFNEKKPFF